MSQGQVCLDFCSQYFQEAFCLKNIAYFVCNWFSKLNVEFKCCLNSNTQKAFLFMVDMAKYSVRTHL